ncbi:hypothetical protein OF001_U30131 [Pseudomonas sp. OF001]|nr:hypothetical protein OF001_U30131 [Pseudomonas sp. OF001]
MRWNGDPPKLVNHADNLFRTESRNSVTVAMRSEISNRTQ